MTVRGPTFMALQVRLVDRSAEFDETRLERKRAGPRPRAGCPAVVTPFDSPSGRTFTVADPDGSVITIHDQA